jgi:SAM-dependent methyltransferase
LSEGLPLRVIEVSRRPVYDAALAISVVVLAGNGLWSRDGGWLITRRVLLATLTAVIVNALIDVSLDQRLRRRLTASDPTAEAPPRVIGPWARGGAMTLTLIALFGGAWLIPGDPPFSLILAFSTVSLTLVLGVAERSMARRAAGEGRDLEPPSTGDVVLAVALLGLCAVDAVLGLSQRSSPVRVFALVLISAVVLVARSVDAALRQRRAMVASFERANQRLHDTMRVKGNNWGAAEDSARDATWATQTLLDALDLRPGQKVADVGAGAGYFTRKLCERVGATGRVYATDRDLWAASKLRELGEREGFTQLQTMHVDDRVPLPISERVDRALLVNVGLFALNREREGRAHFQDLAAKIFPGGRLVVFQEFVHQAGWRSEPGFPALPDDDADADTVVTWAEAHFEVLDRPALPDPVRPYRPHEEKGYLLILRRR